MPEQSNPSQANEVPPKLQAVGFGELLDTIFSLYRTHFLSFFGIASGYFMTIVIVILIAFLDDSVGRNVRVALWVPIVIAVFGISLFVVSRLVFAGAQVCLENRISVGEVLRQGRQQFLPYFVGSFLFGIITIFCVFLSGFVLASLILSYIRSSTGTNGVEIVTVNVILRVFAPLIMVSTVGFFITYWSFFVSATLLEGTSMRVGFRRSRALISGRRWRVIGTVIAIFLLSFAIGFILRTVFAFLFVITGLEGVGNFREIVQWMAIWELPTKWSELRLSYALMYLVNLGIDTFTMPIWVIGFTRLYFDQRIRKEGFDIEVMATRQGE
ncbi:hypothetical protein F4054_22905 [Candidatus Poribacteria bacterium]|nr:hypothetical protein [Candidatus Poribacteria bacterium]MYG06714.1 hypothetical protein [Candidatus Poribacteria bacterium]MYK25102.1 hypothetical protein [Candidatus Poribacteria bacterium]